jgi:hypothetical protein
MNHPPPFRVIIAGSRGFNDYAALCAYADKMLSRKAQEGQIIIVSGHCRGADLLGEQYARERGYGIDLHPADWQRYDTAAGPIRNKEMAAAAHALIVFWDGKSRGTKSMIDEARAAGLPVRIFRY